MAEITVNIPDDMDDRQRQDLAGRLSAVVAQTVRRQRGNGRQAQNSGSVMDLAGCFPYDGPLISKENARETARRHVAENFLGKDG